MNIYQIQEDGDWKCWQAESMQMAVILAQQAFVNEAKDDVEWDLDEEPADYWQRTVLQSCALIGELANPVEKGHATDG